MATIPARFASTCPTCSQRIQPGQSVEWIKGSPARHVDCSTATVIAPAATPATPVVTYETVGARVYVRGNTFAIRDAIKAAGGHWDGEQKAWWVGATKRVELEAAIASAKPAAQSSYRPSRCKQCGAAADRYRKIYRTGVCGRFFDSDP